MSTTLPNGLIAIDEGNTAWYDDITANWTLLDQKVGTVNALKPVATSGDYNDLTNKPTIPAAQVNSDWNASSGVAQILNKPQTEQWEFTVDDGQGGTTTVIKNIYVG